MATNPALESVLAELRNAAAENSSMGLLEREAVALWQYIVRLQDAVLVASDVVNGEGDHHDNAEAIETAADEVRELGVA